MVIDIFMHNTINHYKNVSYMHAQQRNSMILVYIISMVLTASLDM